MKKFNRWGLLFLAIIASISFQNCTGGNVGMIYGVQNSNPTREYNSYNSVYKYGVLFHLASIPGQLGSNAGSDSKGESCSHSALWLFSWGDSSIESAKKAGKISAVSSIEYKQLGILAGALYHQFCTTVLGSGSSSTKAADADGKPANTQQRR
ncbi:TRL-like family protein [Leptospira ryugenii]|uniref:TRL-like family protein n=1 Tax=Leptospira ryugenii TaxID=1917863 RepID=A0A2P2E2D1_9LEPT|nr:TRL-like family protein [Leptospira ryugenii]GBF50966.1 TRL-like family protein [Leptospira ryugenii]